VCWGGRSLAIIGRLGAWIALSVLVSGAGCASPDDGQRAVVEQAGRAATEASPRVPERRSGASEAPPALPSRDRPSGVRLASLPDGDLPFDCAPIRAAIASERATHQWAPDADVEALRMLNEVPHQYIAPDLLVEFLMPPYGHGRPTVGAEEEQLKQITRMKLCDKLYREIVSRQFAAFYPAYR
jgi:hypothetical protein